MRAHIEKTVLDCPNPRQLAEFYAALLDLPICRDDGEWVVIGGEDDGTLAFQRADDYRAPDWPGSDRPQQSHLDIRVDDATAGEQRVLELGATILSKDQSEEGFRVYADPAGHPFCLVYDVASTT